MDILSQLLLILYLILTYDTALGDISNNTRVFYMEPPYCHHNITLEYGEEIILESSNRSSVYNQDGVCTAHIWNKNTTKHLIYLFELGKNRSIHDLSNWLTSSSFQEGPFISWLSNYRYCLLNMILFCYSEFNHTTYGSCKNIPALHIKPPLLLCEKCSQPSPPLNMQ